MEHQTYKNELDQTITGTPLTTTEDIFLYMTFLSPGQEPPSHSPVVPNSQLDESKDGKNNKNNERQRSQHTHFTNQQLQEL